MLQGYIKHLVKDKKGDNNRSDNYREEMISNNLLKLLEYALLSMLKRRIDLSPYQFGYRHAMSTVMAVRSSSVPCYIINLINIMFLNSFFCVKYDDAISKKWNLKRGVRQGGVLWVSYFVFILMTF